MSNVIGYVNKLESFGAVDGPGVRYLIFLNGCRMRCAFCHNPETWAEGHGQEFTADELLKKALRFKPYWKKDGGITVSGGEPLLQIDFVLDLFKKAKAQGISTCIDTAGQPFTHDEPFYSKWKELMSLTDIVLLDIKNIDPVAHKELTGVDNANILQMAQEISDMNIPIWIRHVLVPGGSDNDDYLRRTREFIDTLKSVERVEVLPYHTLGVPKYIEMGIPYRLEGVESPSSERIENAKKILGVK
ncbi:pyruvate formate lyase activating enzyme [Pseudobutyrivibrio sp. 49]|uniref:pyruvate formate-lyase-activating protein n=1 Tax=Pseudobutyrivibrio sp. 49 TaxID=1855344 RepID=UPI000881E384|nr:pyruvate formate-lyase-activating protein [Pseudobutyrivibrio sp. 49]SDI42103.1 pyruvate formate lyase activating enzyme [Pseudobutyrivibrio sp. 49]